MKKFIIGKFVKNPENVKDPATRASYGTVAGSVGIVSNFILCLLKISTGLIFNSIALLADGVNNLSDAAVSLITLFGFKLSAKRPDKDHPYGHGRSEYLTGLIVSVMILAIGCALFYSSLMKTIHPEPLEYSMVSITVLVISILIKLWQMSFYVDVGKLIDSDALTATSADSRNDVISTAAVLLSTITGRFSALNTDGPVGILVALFIIWSGIGLIKDTVTPIIGKAPEPGMVEELSRELRNADGVLGIHDLMIHDYGPGRLIASVHVEVDGNRNFFEVHDSVDNLENKIRENMGILMTIHMDPVSPGDPVIEELKAILEEALPNADGVEGFHDVRVIPGPTHVNVVFDVTVGHDCKLSDDEVIAVFSDALREKDERYRAVISLDRTYI